MITVPYIPHGTLATRTIQCTHPDTGETGDWLFICGDHRAKERSVSPCFSELFDLYRWAKENNWEELGQGRFRYIGPSIEK